VFLGLARGCVDGFVCFVDAAFFGGCCEVVDDFVAGALFFVVSAKRGSFFTEVDVTAVNVVVVVVVGAAAHVAL